MNYTEFFTNRSTGEISKDLLGRSLSYNNGKEILSGTIVEAEAYVGIQACAVISYGGRRTPASACLYCQGGSLYIDSPRLCFFFDVSCQEECEPQGVLIRAIDPLTGIDTMIKNRSGKTGPLLTNGPGKMMQA